MSDGDPFTTEVRLCDDSGMVSHDRTPPNLFDRDLTYLGQLNNLRAATPPHGEHKPVREPFACTGSAHLAGMHIRCTSPAHRPAAPTANATWTQAPPAERKDGR